MSDLFSSVANKKKRISSFQISNTVRELMDSLAGVNLIEEKLEDINNIKFDSKITGMMVLKGNYDVVLALTFSEFSASYIVGKMAGMEGGKINQEDIFDGIMEITNQIAGRIKSKLVTEGYAWSATIPFAIIGADHYVFHKEKAMGYAGKLKDKGFEMLLKVIYL